MNLPRIIWHQGAPVLYPVPHDPTSVVWYAMLWDHALVDQQATIEAGEWTVTPAAADPPAEGDMVIEDSQIGIDWTVAGEEYHAVCAVKLSGGINGERYNVTCQVITSSGETLEKSFVLRVADN